jgi:NAD+ kinase
VSSDLHDTGHARPGALRSSRPARPARGAPLAPRRVGILLHPTRGPVSTLTAVSLWAARHDIEVVAAGSQLPRLPPDIAPVALDQLLDRVDLLFAAGGDGTTLRAMHLAAPRDVPVLAINLGRLGYLADVDASRVDAALEALTRGRYTIDRWGALELRCGALEPALGFNDIVLRRTAGARPVTITVGIDGELLARYSGDGLIVATAAGSTAYSFAAGGPIVSPTLAATVVTPLAPHTPFNRPLVVSAGESVGIDVLASSSRMSIEIDGQEHGDAAPGDRLCIVSSPLSAQRVHVEQIGFASRARSKLRITDSVELDA